MVYRGVSVDLIGRSHTVYRVSIAGEVQFFAKCFGPRRGDTDGFASCEQAVLALASERPAVKALIPPPWPWHDTVSSSKRWEIVATAAQPGNEAWKLDANGDNPSVVAETWEKLVKSLVPALSAFHRDTRDLARSEAACPAALRSRLPWGLCLMDGDAPPELWATPQIASLLHLAAADSLLVSGLREARRMWRPLALIHADLKHDNVLVESTPEGWKVTVLDWEMARVGDPAWDLATLTSRLVAITGENPPWSAATVAAAALLARTYSNFSGLGLPGLVRRLLLYVGTALLILALQLASMLPLDADFSEARQLILKSRATFAGLEALTTSVLTLAEELP